MNNRNILTVILVTIILISSATFIVDEREVAIKFRLGEIVRAYQDPGLYFMIPFINKLLSLKIEPSKWKTVLIEFPNVFNIAPDGRF